MFVEMHTHTREGSPRCGKIPFEELVRECKAEGIEAVCLTDHNQFPAPALMEQFRAQYGIKLFPGIEWTLKDGHFLVFGLHRLPKADVLAELRNAVRTIEAEPGDDVPAPFLSAIGEKLTSLRGNFFPDSIGELVAFVKQNGGRIFWAHPLDDFSALRQAFNRFVAESGDISAPAFEKYLERQQEGRSLLTALKAVDGIEIRNGFDRQLGVEGYFAEQLAAHFGLPGIGCSDVHTKKMVGTYVMDCEEDVRDLDHLMQIVVSGRGYTILNREQRKRKMRNAKKKERA